MYYVTCNLQPLWDSVLNGDVERGGKECGDKHCVHCERFGFRGSAKPKCKRLKNYFAVSHMFVIKNGNKTWGYILDMDMLKYIFKCLYLIVVSTFTSDLCRVCISAAPFSSPMKTSIISPSCCS